MKMFMFVLMLVSWTKGENFTRALYPCVRPIEKLKNDNSSLTLPLKLKSTLLTELSKFERYLIPLPSANDLCDYIQKKVPVILARVHINLWENDKGSNTSVNASILLNDITLLSTEYLISKVIEIRREFCTSNDKVFSEEKFECLTPKPDDEEASSGGSSSIGIHLTAVLGNIASIIGQVVLLILFSKVKNMHAPRKCIIFLSITQGLLHILQLASLYLYKIIQACTVISISSHWIDLSAFVWLCCASYETNWILSGKSSFTKQERFTAYSSFAFGLTAVVVLSCTIIHFSSGDSIGYGKGQYCFIGNKWSNFYSFVLPISIAFFFGAVWTVYNYRVLVTSPKGSHFRRNEPDLLIQARLSVAIRITLLCIVILFSRLLDTFWKPSELAMSISKILISLQGVAIFFGIVASRDVIRSVKSASYGKQQDRLTYAYKYRKRMNYENNA